ncbi:Ataxin-7-like protein 3 [Podila minutissima]|uniref:SAGA-associated factor 11 n=1 Tax=Podila minutissima TaxID=64525 RepID=A0A9P5VMT4_9FUNG|nr:Ataxin-7-like protein 3 [Podila minutissima]
MSSPLARSSSTMSSSDIEALFAKIHKDQASQLELLRHTKRAMDKSLASKDSADNGGASLASLSFEILSELLDEIVLDVVSESHREVKNMRSIFVRAGLDIFGQNPQSNSTQAYDCVHCQRSFPAQRYAPHLEKCLGLAGRASSRVASRRMGAGERAGSGSPFTPVSYSDDREASDSDKDVVEKKRKKNTNNGGGYASGNGSASTKENGDYSTPSSSKSSSTGKGSKGGSTKLKGLGLFTPPTGSAPRPPTPVGEISLGFLDDSLLLANGRTLQNGGGSVGSSAPVSTSQKLSSSNPKRANGISSSGSGSGAGAGSASATVSVSSQKRPPGGNIDGDGDEDGMDILQTPKKKK